MNMFLNQTGITEEEEQQLSTTSDSSITEFNENPTSTKDRVQNTLFNPEEALKKTVENQDSELDNPFQPTNRDTDGAIDPTQEGDVTITGDGVGDMGHLESRIDTALGEIEQDVPVDTDVQDRWREGTDKLPFNLGTFVFPGGPASAVAADQFTDSNITNVDDKISEGVDNTVKTAEETVDKTVKKVQETAENVSPGIGDFFGDLKLALIGTAVLLFVLALSNLTS